MTDQAEKKEKWEGPSRMTDDEVRAFVLGVCDGRIFTSAQVRDDSLLGMIFMPLGLGAFADVERAVLETIGCVYENLEKAGPRSVNGYPIFFSMKVMHVEDWKRALDAIKTESERRRSIVV